MDYFFELRKSADSIAEYIHGATDGNPDGVMARDEREHLDECLLQFVKAIEQLSARIDKLEARERQLKRAEHIAARKQRVFEDAIAAEHLGKVGIRGARNGAKE